MCVLCVLRRADAAALSVGGCEGHSNLYHGGVHEHTLIPSSQGSPVISCPEPLQLLPHISDPTGLCEAAECGCATTTPASTTVTSVCALRCSCSSFKKLVCTEESVLLETTGKYALVAIIFHPKALFRAETVFQLIWLQMDSLNKIMGTKGKKSECCVQ